MILFEKNIIISGASEGLGFEIAKHFIAEGANVLLCARTENRLLQALENLQKRALPHTKIYTYVTDVSDPQAVQAFIKFALEKFTRIDVLVANAGVYGPKGPVDETDWQAWSQAIDINLKGTVLQCLGVLPSFKAQRKGKILILSGGGATQPLPNLSAYAASKTAVVRFAETLAQEVKAFHIDVNCVAPGALNTRLLDEIITAGPHKVGATFYEKCLAQKANGGTPFSVPTALCSFLASNRSDNITGRLLSALWDPWEKLADLKDELADSDIYTLRRIVPQDRQKTWAGA